MRLKSLFSAMFVSLLAMTLSGCLIFQPKERPPENLLTKCPQELPMLTDGTGKDVVLTMRDWANQYHDCKTRHNGLVDAINEATK